MLLCLSLKHLTIIYTQGVPNWMTSFPFLFPLSSHIFTHQTWTDHEQITNRAQSIYTRASVIEYNDLFCLVHFLASVDKNRVSRRSSLRSIYNDRCPILARMALFRQRTKWYSVRQVFKTPPHMLQYGKNWFHLSKCIYYILSPPPCPPYPWSNQLWHAKYEYALIGHTLIWSQLHNLNTGYTGVSISASDPIIQVNCGE